MVALTAPFSVSVTSKRIQGKRKVHKITMVIGDGASTYPALGVPLTIQKFGMARFLEFLNLQDSSGDGYLYKYDSVNQKIRIYQGDNTNAAAAPAVELGAVVPVATSIVGEAIGW
jgi:hypothetical protein